MGRPAGHPAEYIAYEHGGLTLRQPYLLSPAGDPILAV